MKKCRKALKFFSFLAIFIFALFLASPKASAMYKPELNKVVDGSIKFAPNTNEFSLIVQYQYQVKDVQVYICRADLSNKNCEKDYISLLRIADDFADVNSKMEESDINKTNQETQTYSFSPNSVYDGTPIDGFANGTYKIMVKASFCILRTNDKSSCEIWEVDNNNRHPIIHEETITINSAYTDNTKINQTIDSIIHIVNSYAIPVLWVLLGILLVVRGVMLAIDIVKASDEADVRQKKISGLVWLIIGVFAGYAITIAAHAVMNMLGYGGIFS